MENGDNKIEKTRKRKAQWAKQRRADYKKNVVLIQQLEVQNLKLQQRVENYRAKYRKYKKKYKTLKPTRTIAPDPIDKFRLPESIGTPTFEQE